MIFALVLVVVCGGIGTAVRWAHDSFAARQPGGRADAPFVAVLGAMTVLTMGIIILVAVAQTGWPFIIALVAVTAATVLGLTWRRSLPAIGRALAQPRVMRPIVIGGIAILAIWLFGASLPFRVAVTQLAFLAFVVWLGLNLLKPFKLAKKKD